MPRYRVPIVLYTEGVATVELKSSTHHPRIREVDLHGCFEEDYTEIEVLWDDKELIEDGRDRPDSG